MVVAYDLQLVSLGWISFSSHAKYFKNSISNFILGPYHQRYSMEKKLAGSIVVLLGKALNKLQSFSDAKKRAGLSSLYVAVAQSN